MEEVKIITPPCLLTGKLTPSSNKRGEQAMNIKTLLIKRRHK